MFTFRSSTLFFAAVLYFSANQFAFADEEAAEGDAEEEVGLDDEEHPLNDLPGMAPDVEVAARFPDARAHNKRELPHSGTMEIVYTMINAGETEYNVTFAMGSLNAPFDFSQHIMNYSKEEYGVSLPPRSEVSFAYSFDTPSFGDLDQDYVTAITVFYESPAEIFSSTFYNSTVRFYAQPKPWTLQTLARVLFWFVFFAAVSLVCYDYFASDATKKSHSKAFTKKVGNVKAKLAERETEAKVETGTESSPTNATSEGWEFLPATSGGKKKKA